MSRVLACLIGLLLLASPSRAGTFSFSPWTTDSSTHIESGSTLWAYRFGSTTALTVDGISVTGILGPTASNERFDLTGTTRVYPVDDSSNVTGAASAPMARRFVYGGAPASVTVKGLTIGVAYTVSFFSVGSEAAGGRRVNFVSGSDSAVVDQDQYGRDNGIRVDYSFTADAATQPITLSPLVSGATWNFHGITLRREISLTTVTTTDDSGAGSLRWALRNAQDLSGADSVVFATALSGRSIILASEMLVNDPSGVTVDAGALKGGLTLSGNDAVRIFAVDTGGLTIRGLKLQAGRGIGASNNAAGGAVSVNAAGASFVARECTFVDNSAEKTGGALFNNGGIVVIERSTFNLNTTRSDSGIGGGGEAGGAIANAGVMTLRHCTLQGNTTFEQISAGDSAGAIVSTGIASSLTLEHCTISGNVSGGGSAANKAGIVVGTGSTATLRYCVVQDSFAAGAGTSTTDVFAVSGATVDRAANNIISASGGPGIHTGIPPLAGDALLGPLANNGGLTPTMALRTDSPAINGAAGSLSTTDQRGVIISNTPDIGAYEKISSSVVTSTADGGIGSLRTAIFNVALTHACESITFDPSLSGQTVTLASEITIGNDGPYCVTVDASSLPGGLTIDGGPGNNRILSLTAQDPTSYKVYLSGITLTGGNAGGEVASGRGGAIYNDMGMLTLTRCVLTGNSADSGGAIYNSRGGVALNQCTFSANSATSEGGAIKNYYGSLGLVKSALFGNSAYFGGAVLSAGNSFLSRCTLYANTANRGGAIFNGNSGSPNLSLSHCTVSGNSASQSGGGIFNQLSLTVENCIVAENTAHALNDDLYNENYAVKPTYTRSGSNIVIKQYNYGNVSIVGPDPSTADPMLAPLGNYGGPTKTMALLPGSPARNTVGGATSSGTSDQRNLPILGIADIGAYEAQLAPIAPQTTNEDQITPAIGFTVGSVGPLTALSNNPALVPVGNIIIGGSGSSRTITLSPAADASGSSIITLVDTLTGETQSFALTVRAVNDAPSFLKGADQTVPGNSGPRTVPGWATAVRAGPADENGQTLQFSLGTSTSTPSLFANMPTVDSDGTLRFTPAPNRIGSASFTITLRDDGGGANGGAPARSAEQTFTIAILPDTMVTSTLDSGEGSLRQALIDSPPGGIIGFAPDFAGPITLASVLTLTKSVVIDASTLRRGLIINDGAAETYRLFTVDAGIEVEFRALTLADGGGPALAEAGAILNHGNLRLSRCTIRNCSSISDAGALLNSTSGALTLTRCTLSNNRTSNGGGAIRSSGSLSVTHCTLSGNTGGQGGGIHNSGLLTLAYSIVSGNNIQGMHNDIFNSGPSAVLTIIGTSLVEGLAHDSGGSVIGNGTLNSADPMLAPLDNYGGLTPTMALLAASPARDGAGVSTEAEDQRGSPIFGTPDIGAYEAGFVTNFPAYAAEAPGAALSPAGDTDHDGRSDLLEYAIQSDPRAPSRGEIIPVTYLRTTTGSIIQANIAFQTRSYVNDIAYTLKRSDSLSENWSTVASWNTSARSLSVVEGVTASRNGVSGVVSITDTNLKGLENAFYRLEVVMIP